MSIIIGIDASRNRSGGAKAHLIGVLTGDDPRKYGISKVHLWAYRSLINSIPDSPWLVKHSPAVLEKSLLSQLWWQYKNLPQEARELGCNIMLNTDAGSICPFYPSITISQDMLSFEPGEISRFWPSKAWLRLFLLKYIQAYSLKKSYGAIFLTQHASKVIQETTGEIKKFKIIPHGVSEVFQAVGLARKDKFYKSSEKKLEEIKLLYVSNAALYKHQWQVIKAVDTLKKQSFSVSLLLVGGGSGKAQKLLEQALNQVDPEQKFIQQQPFVKHEEIPSYLSQADIFIFASSCENMPNTLLEAMASALPIACSDRGPMPEVLENGGVYFNPEDTESISRAIQKIINGGVQLQEQLGLRALEISKKYSWERCASETWAYLQECVTELAGKN